MDHELLIEGLEVDEIIALDEVFGIFKREDPAQRAKREFEERRRQQAEKERHDKALAAHHDAVQKAEAERRSAEHKRAREDRQGDDTWHHQYA